MGFNELNLNMKDFYKFYMIMAIPTIVLSWYLDFPRGYFVSFIGISIFTIILSYFESKIVINRAVWKEYLIGLIGLLLIPIIVYYQGGMLYITLMDLYYYFIGMTVFELSIMPFICFYKTETTNNRDSFISTISIIFSMAVMFAISYILFIWMRIEVMN